MPCDTLLGPAAITSGCTWPWASSRFESSKIPRWRGHFGYAVELGNKALPPGFSGRLPRERVANRPFFEAIEGLAESASRNRKAQGRG